MKLAFALFKYFPFGGLQRDMLRIASVCRERGHEIKIYTLSWDGERPAGMDIQIIDINRVSNHARYKAFHEQVMRHLKSNPVDLLVGFNKMPDLDYYYAADSCVREKLIKERGWLARFLPRYRFFLKYEEAVFAPKLKTQVLMISPIQREIFLQHYGTEENRIHMLPPGLSKDRMAPPDANELRASFREEFGLAEEDRLILCIGSGFKTKGLDRSLKALASLPDDLKQRTLLLAIGQDNPKRFYKLAKFLGVSDRFEVVQGRNDIPKVLQGGDLLLHPAYYEAAGIVLVESIVAGLPVLTTDNCGYAFHVNEAGAGRVIKSPFQQQVLNEALAEMLVSDERRCWSENGIRYGREKDLYGMPELAGDLILAGGKVQ